MSKCERLVVFFTKNDSKKVRVYKEKILFKSQENLVSMLSQRTFEDSSEKFYLVFDVKEIDSETLSRLRLG